MSVFVDTNILIYHLTDVDQAKNQRCTDLLERAERSEVDLVTSEFVIAEAVWFLQYRLSLPREHIRDVFTRILRLPGLRVPNKPFLTGVFDLYSEKQLNFVDAYNAIMMEQAGIGQIYSFDRDFDRVEGIERVEP